MGVDLQPLVSPPTPVTSLREHTRSHALRAGRTCYRHLAGQLGVQLLGHLIASDWLADLGTRDREDRAL